MNLGKKIPATVITGFLGAGKTTLVGNLIATAEGRRIALIVNEFGDMGFDGSLLGDCGVPGCAAEEVIELNNGCICCTVADDFLPAMESLLDREDPPEHIVIETSGLALPQPLVRAFQWPGVKNRVTVDGVVTVVDCAAVANGQVAADVNAVEQQRKEDESIDHENPIEELFEDQLACADLIVLNKVDLVEGTGMDLVEERIKSGSRPGVRTIKSEFGRISAEVLLGLDSGAETDMDSRKSHHELHHENGEDHHHDDFESILIGDLSFDSLDEATQTIESAMKISGVLRIKGRVGIRGKDAPAIVQAVGPRVQSWFGSPGDTASGLVVIGLHDFNSNEIMMLLSSEKAA